MSLCLIELTLSELTSLTVDQLLIMTIDDCRPAAEVDAYVPFGTIRIGVDSLYFHDSQNQIFSGKYFFIALRKRKRSEYPTDTTSS